MIDSLRNVVWEQDLIPQVDYTVNANYLDNTLTEYQQNVLTLLANGLRNKEVSERLVTSVHTTKKHVSSIYDRIQHSRPDRLRPINTIHALQMITHQGLATFTLESDISLFGFADILTPRQKQVLFLSALGYSRAETAIALSISENSVQRHRRLVMIEMSNYNIDVKGKELKKLLKLYVLGLVDLPWITQSPQQTNP